MSCERQGHVGGEDSGNDPKYRCLYCGSWGYASHWFTNDKEEYENCEQGCETWEEHRDLANGCPDPEPEVCDCGCNAPTTGESQETVQGDG